MFFCTVALDAGYTIFESFVAKFTDQVRLHRSVASEFVSVPKFTGWARSLANATGVSGKVLVLVRRGCPLQLRSCLACLRASRKMRSHLRQVSALAGVSALFLGAAQRRECVQNWLLRPVSASSSAFSLPGTIE